jgi:hypothetical protein
MISREREIANSEKQRMAMCMMQYEVNQVSPLVVMDGLMAFFTISRLYFVTTEHKHTI